ncbi:uncharacterized protein TA11085 [Theileria annulata]|uniref:S1 motif domain-containing protein n=1 Tax=Theileria annulata TaxID=5874 RepID=Q4U8G7_THEAN|nr:uncharacterized protein TA11085 [Theileria annulata]CAI76886.1 hypothetical protein, conserved [Theileria annulata]|eukprot:XP_953511.1 hypothetical protein, conserved [Theileria annulata]
MILYILIFSSFVTIHSYRNHTYIPNFQQFNTKLDLTKEPVNLINCDIEFQGHIGFEATEKIKEKLPKSIEFISKKMVKNILDHDLDVINNKPNQQKPKWKIRNNKKRFDVCHFKVGEKVKGRVSSVFPTYALVDIGSTKYAVLHARDLSLGWVDRVDLTLTPGEELDVYIKSINTEFNTIKLSLITPSETGISDKERKPLTNYQIEDVVEGVIVRKSPLGYYVDIGAKVDAFLHISDLKITDRMRKSKPGKNYVNKDKYQIGKKLENLYIKSINILKNRIGLSENTFFEELERNVMTGKETPEQQSSYLRNYSLDFVKELRVRDIENMKVIGGYDDYLKSLNANRNTSVDHLLYLENLQEQRKIKEEQKKLFKDMSSKQKIKRDQEYFNRLTHKLCDLNDSAYEPTNDEKSIYKYGDNKVWTSNVYTPFQFSNNKSNDSDEVGNENQKDVGHSNSKQVNQMNVNMQYFKTLNDEIVDGLKDVQGENFNLKQKYEAVHKYDEPYKLIDYLYDQFHQKPSNLSVQKDKYEYKRGYIHPSITDSTETPKTDSSNVNSADKDNSVKNSDVLEFSADDSERYENVLKREKLIKELLSSDDPDVVEVGEMLNETKNFDPFKHCQTLKESKESEIRGARNLFQDDVMQWNDRVCNLISDNPEIIPDLQPDTTEDKYVKDEFDSVVSPLEEEEIENIDPKVLKSLEEDDYEFTTPFIEGMKTSEHAYDTYKEDLDTFPDYDSNELQDQLQLPEHVNQDESDNLIKCSEPNISKTPTNLSGTDPKFRRHLVNKDEKVDIRSLISKLKKNKKIEKEMSFTDSPLTTLVLNSQPKTHEQHENKANAIINEIKNAVHNITNTISNDVSSGEVDTNINTMTDTVNDTGNSVDDMDNNSVDNVKDYIISQLEKQESLDRFLEESGEAEEDLDVFHNKNDLKLLIKYAKKNLTPNDYSAIEKLTRSGNEYTEQRIMDALKSCYSREEEKTKYKYYEEGYDKYLYNLENSEQNSDDGTKAYETNAKFRILMKNTNFLNMLKRLNVDENMLNVNNITQLLPQQYHFQRMTPTTELT